MELYDQINVISHTDLDGYGVNVLVNFLKTGNLNTNYLVFNIPNSSGIIDKVKEILDNAYDKSLRNSLIVINDLAMNQKDVEKFINIGDSYNKKLSLKRGTRNKVHFIICDHHMGSAYYELNPIHDDLIDTFINTGSNRPAIQQECGTMLFKKYVFTRLCDISKINIQQSRLLNEFVDHVNNHDCWIWKDRDPFAEKLNMYFSAVDNNIFVMNVTSVIANSRINDMNVSFENEFIKYGNVSFIISERERDIRNTCLKMLNNCKVSKFNEYVIGTIICDRYISYVGNYICECRPDIDFCMILNPMQNYVSFRGTKDDINLARLSSRLFNGGGHRLSAAAVIKKDVMLHLIQDHL